ncbi:MAG: hypothetical protein ABFD25_00950, partial [Clostridiaceae bacterium]
MPEQIILKPRSLGMSTLCGMRIIENKSLVVPSGIRQKKTHKFKLINWLLAKLYGYVTVYKPDPNVYKVLDSLIGHPETIKAIIQKVQEATHETQ